MKNPNSYYCYEHWRPDKDVCFYVGKGKRGRAYDMKTGRNKYHRNIQGKLARLGMCVEIRLVADGLSEIDAYAQEKSRIAFWRSVGVRLTNLTDGGDGVIGLKRSEAWKKALGDRFRGRRLSDETKAKISAAGKLRKSSQETRAKQSVSAKESWTSERRLEASRRRAGHKMPAESIAKAMETKKKNNPQIGLGRKPRVRVDPEIARQNRSAARKRLCEDPVFRKRQGDGNRGRKQSDEEIAKRAISLKAAWDRRKAADPSAGKLSDEQRRAISMSLTGRKQSAETRQKRSASLLAAWNRGDFSKRGRG